MRVIHHPFSVSSTLHLPEAAGQEHGGRVSQLWNECCSLSLKCCSQAARAPCNPTFLAKALDGPGGFEASLILYESYMMHVVSTLCCSPSLKHHRRTTHAPCDLTLPTQVLDELGEREPLGGVHVDVVAVVDVLVVHILGQHAAEGVAAGQGGYVGGVGSWGTLDAARARQGRLKAAGLFNQCRVWP